MTKAEDAKSQPEIRQQTPIITQSNDSTKAGRGTKRRKKLTNRPSNFKGSRVKYFDKHRNTNDLVDRDCIITSRGCSQLDTTLESCVRSSKEAIEIPPNASLEKKNLHIISNPCGTSTQAICTGGIWPESGQSIEANTGTVAIETNQEPNSKTKINRQRKRPKFKEKCSGGDQGKSQKNGTNSSTNSTGKDSAIAEIGERNGTKARPILEFSTQENIESFSSQIVGHGKNQAVMETSFDKIPDEIPRGKDGKWSRKQRRAWHGIIKPTAVSYTHREVNAQTDSKSLSTDNVNVDHVHVGKIIGFPNGNVPTKEEVGTNLAKLMNEQSKHATETVSHIIDLNYEKPRGKEGKFSRKQRRALRLMSMQQEVERSDRVNRNEPFASASVERQPSLVRANNDFNGIENFSKSIVSTKMISKGENFLSTENDLDGSIVSTKMISKGGKSLSTENDLDGSRFETVVVELGETPRGRDGKLSRRQRRVLREMMKVRTEANTDDSQIIDTKQSTDIAGGSVIDKLDEANVPSSRCDDRMTSNAIAATKESQTKTNGDVVNLHYERPTGKGTQSEVEIAIPNTETMVDSNVAHETTIRENTDPRNAWAAESREESHNLYPGRPQTDEFLVSLPAALVAEACVGTREQQSACRQLYSTEHEENRSYRIQRGLMTVSKELMQSGVEEEKVEKSSSENKEMKFQSGVEEEKVEKSRSENKEMKFQSSVEEEKVEKSRSEDKEMELHSENQCNTGKEGIKMMEIKKSCSEDLLRSSAAGTFVGVNNLTKFPSALRVDPLAVSILAFGGYYKESLADGQHLPFVIGLQSPSPAPQTKSSPVDVEPVGLHPVFAATGNQSHTNSLVFDPSSVLVFARVNGTLPLFQVEGAVGYRSIDLASSANELEAEYQQGRTEERTVVSSPNLDGEATIRGSQLEGNGTPAQWDGITFFIELLIGTGPIADIITGICSCQGC